MCRTTAAPLMAMAGMAGTAVGVAIAVIRERADRIAIEREAKKIAKKAREESGAASGEAGDNSPPPSDGTDSK